MKTKLKFAANLFLLAVFDVAILMNIKVIYSKGLSLDILENVLLLVTVVFAGVVVLKDTYGHGRKMILDQRRFDSPCEDDEWLEEDYLDEEY
mgnify:CR=1 FL=1